MVSQDKNIQLMNLTAPGLYLSYICCLVSTKNPTQPNQNSKSLSCVKCTNSVIPEDTPDHSFCSNGCAGGSIALCQDKWQWGCRGAIFTVELVCWAVHFLSSLFVLAASQSKWCRNAALDSEWGHGEAYFSLESHTIQKNNLVGLIMIKNKHTNP